MGNLKKIEFFLSLKIAQFKGAVKKVDREFKTIVRSGQAFRRTLNDLNGHTNTLRSTLLRFGAVMAGGAVFGAAARSAFGFNQTLEQSRIGIAALERTFKGVDMETSFEQAADIQRRLQIAGLKTTATYAELLRALQEGIGPALRENFDPAQIVSFASSMTQAAAALSLPMDQLGQELRAILDGTIDRNARIARALQIDNSQIKKWKQAGTLFANLQDKLKAFAAAGDQAANTFGGAFSNMQDAIQMALGQGTQKTFKATTEAIKRLTGAIVSIDEEAGTFSFNEKIIAAIDGIDQRISSFLESLTADDIAAALESIIKTMGGIVDILGSFGGAVVMVTNALGPFAPLVATLAGNFLLLSSALKIVSFALLGPYRLIKGMGASLAFIKQLQLVSFLGGLRTAFIGAASGATAMSIALKGILVLAAADAVIKIGRLVAVLWDWRKATNELAAAQIRVKAQKDWIDPQIASKLAEINTALGTNYKTMAELFQAQKDGKITYDDLTATWVRGEKAMAEATTKSAATRQQVTGKALDAMKKAYQAYADQIKKIQDEIAGREKSLAEQLRAMARTGMSDLSAWRDRKKEAQEYEAAAKKAAEAGNFEAAVKLADQAKSAYQDLNREVKSNDRVLVSQGKALKTAMTGVESAGKLAIEILKKQKTAANEAAAALDDKAGGQLSGKIKKDLDETQKALDNFSGDWGKVWEAMQKDTVAKTKKAMDNVEREIRKVVDKKTGRTVYIDVVTREKKKTGGPVGFKTGGKLPGFGGGDRIPALLEAGEFIIRKEAVSKFGAGIFHALNSFRVPELPKFAAGGPVMAGAGGGGETININLDFGTGQPINVQANRVNADELLRQVARKNRLRSA